MVHRTVGYLSEELYSNYKNETAAIDFLKKEAIRSLNEIEKIIVEEFNYNNEKEADNLTKQLFMVMVFLASLMMQLRNSYGVNYRKAFKERHVLDRYMQEMENKLQSFLHPNTVLDIKEYCKHKPAFPKEFLRRSQEYADERVDAYVRSLKKYYKDSDVEYQFNKVIKLDEAKAKKGSRSRKLSLDNIIYERKVAMHGIKTRLEGLIRDVDNESSEEEATKEDMKYELSKLFGEMRENLVTAIKKPGRDSISSSCSASSGYRFVTEMKDRIRKDMVRMESGIRNMVANDVKMEEKKCLMLLYSIANVFLPSIEWIVLYARKYNGKDFTFTLEEHLRDKEEEFITENTMNMQDEEENVRKFRCID